MSQVGQPRKPETFTEGPPSKPTVLSEERPSQPEALREEEPSQQEAFSEEQASKSEASNEEPLKPVTFGEVFPALEKDPVAGKSITLKDAAVMHSAESLVFGNSQKGGPTAKMQSAAAKNLREGHTDRDSPTSIAGKPTEPVTYGEVFPSLGSIPVASEAITLEDASLMQTAESMAFGKTQKGGPASMMQSAAARNVQDGLVERDAHSTVAEEGVSVTETAVPGAVMDVAYVAGVPVAGIARPTPTDPLLASMDAVTIGEALEAAALGAGDRPLTEDDARAILSAEARATGISMPSKGGISATAQSAVQFNLQHDGSGQMTLADVLMDATADLKADKVVTYEDALKVAEAELRGGTLEDLSPDGVGASLVAAAFQNEKSSVAQPPILEETTVVTAEKLEEKGADSLEGIGSYEKLDPVDESKTKDADVEPEIVKLTSQDSEQVKLPEIKPSADGEDAKPLVDQEQPPSHDSTTPLPIPKPSDV